MAMHCLLAVLSSKNYFHDLLQLDIPTKNMFSLQAAIICIRSASCVLLIPLPRILKRHVLKGHYLIKSVICITSSRTFLNKTGSYSNIKYAAMRNVKDTSTVLVSQPDLH